jgi:hypothetical protein
VRWHAYCHSYRIKAVGRAPPFKDFNDFLPIEMQKTRRRGFFVLEEHKCNQSSFELVSESQLVLPWQTRVSGNPAAFAGSTGFMFCGFRAIILYTELIS